MLTYRKQKGQGYPDSQTTLRYDTLRNADEAAAHIDAAFHRAVQDSSIARKMQPEDDTTQTAGLCRSPANSLAEAGLEPARPLRTRDFKSTHTV